MIKSVTDWTTHDYLSPSQFYINGDVKRPVLGNYEVSDDLRSISDNIWMDEGMRQLLATIKAEEKLSLKRPANFPSSSGTVTKYTPSAPMFPPTVVQAGKKKSVRKQDRARVHHDLNRPRSQYFFVPKSPIDGETDCPPHRPIFANILRSLGEIEKDSNIPVFYAMPPGFLLIHSEIDKSVKFYHNYLNIRPALLRILMRGGNFSPIFRRIGEWASILVGNYRKTEPVAIEYALEPVARLYDTLDTASTSRGDLRPENQTRPSKKAKRAAIAAMKVTFGSEYQLPSYNPDLRPDWRGRSISPDMIRLERELRQEIQWELNEVSF